MSLAAPTISGSQTNPTVSYGTDQNLYVEFSLEPLQDDEASLKEGRPIFRDVEYITIHIPGGTNVVKRPVNKQPSGGNPSDLERFPQQWHRFQNQQEQAHDGTPLEEWAPMTKSLVMELKAKNVHTVEQLANLPDSNFFFMGAQDWKQKAKAWIDGAKDGAKTIAMQSEIDSLKKQIEGLMNQNAGLGEEKRRGRPPKEQNDGENAS